MNKLSAKPDPLSAVAELTIRMAVVLLILSLPLLAQSPWETTATRLGQAFTGPIARGFSLVAIVIGGLSLAFSEGGGKRTVGALIFGVGMAMMAVQFLNWLFS